MQGTEAATLCSHLTKAFDFVNRDVLFKLYSPKIVCSLRLPKIIRSFHEDMKGTVSGVWWLNIRCLWHPKWSETGLCPSVHPVWYLFSCVAETWFLFCHGRCLHCTSRLVRSDGKLFSFFRLRAKSKGQLQCLLDFSLLVTQQLLPNLLKIFCSPWTASAVRVKNLSYPWAWRRRKSWDKMWICYLASQRLII